MAKIVLGPTVIGIRGTVAGITFSQNRGGPYARGWHTPPNPRTTKQNAARVALANWAKAWAGLSSTNKTNWNTYAADPAQELTDSLGQAYYVSGFNWFASVNTYRAYRGLAQLSTVPTIAAPSAPTIENVFFSVSASNNPKIKFTTGDPTTGLYKFVFFAVANSVGVTAYPATNYFMRVQVPDTARDIVFKTQAVAKFGNFWVGQRGFYETFAITSEGRYGPTSRAFKDASA